MISFLIPTIRDYENFAFYVVNSIDKHCNFDKEILIYSPNEIEDKRIVWHRDTNQSGDIAGYNYLYSKSQGDYIIVMNDKLMLGNDCIERAVDILNSSYYNNKQYKILSIGSQQGFFPNAQNTYGYTCIHGGYNYRICGFPIFTRSTVDILGGCIANHRFYHHYWDNWLPFYVGSKGEPINDCPLSSLYPVTSIVKQEAASYTQFDAQDKEAYIYLISSYNNNNNIGYNF